MICGNFGNIVNRKKLNSELDKVNKSDLDNIYKCSLIDRVKIDMKKNQYDFFNQKYNISINEIVNSRFNTSLKKFKDNLIIKNVYKCFYQFKNQDNFINLINGTFSVQDINLIVDEVEKQKRKIDINLLCYQKALSKKIPFTGELIIKQALKKRQEKLEMEFINQNESLTKLINLINLYYGVSDLSIIINNINLCSYLYPDLFNDNKKTL